MPPLLVILLSLYSSPQTEVPTATQRLKIGSGLDTLDRQLLAEVARNRSRSDLTSGI